MSSIHSRLLPITAVCCVVLALSASWAAATPGDVTADYVLGQNGSFTSQGQGTTATTLRSPSGVAVDGLGNVYVADTYNNRVLEYDDPLNTDYVADRVFGQNGSFTSKVCNLGGISSSSLCVPMDVAVNSGGDVFIVDWQNNRVLMYIDPVSTDVVADVVFGQAGSFTTGTYYTSPTADTLTNPISVAVGPAGHLYVGDRGMRRVLEYDPPFTDTTADRVFGQFGSFTSGVYNNGGVGPDSLSDILGIGVDGAGNLYVADQTNARALMYNDPIATDTTADLVFGQYGDFTTNAPNNGGVNADSLETPTDVDADGAGNVYITDTGTERTLIYDNPQTYGTTADVVFGMQGNFSNFGNNFGGLSADSQADPWSLAIDAACNTWIVGYGNNRVLEYDKPPHACVEATYPTPTSPIPVTGPVLTTAPGTAMLSFNGGVSQAYGVSITFGSIDMAGNTTVTTSRTGPPVPPPPGFEVMGFRNHGAVGDLTPTEPVYYEI